MTKRDSHLKILWALDVSARHPEIERVGVETIQALSGRVGLEIHPVHLLLPSPVEMSGGLDLSDLSRRRKEAEWEIKAVLERNGITGVASPKVLLECSAGGRNPFELLTSYAHRNAMDLILAGTHAKSGFLRLMSESFVEILMQHSPVPVLSVSPKTVASAQYEEVAFLTDFGEHALEAFRRSVEFAAKLGLPVSVCHCLSPDGSDDVRAFLRTSEDYERLAAEAGVKCRFEFEPLSRVDEPVSEALVRFSHENPARIVALATQSTYLDPRVGTSSARELIEHASVPVWILNPANQPEELQSAVGAGAGRRNNGQ